MTQSLSHVAAGQPIRIKAATWNTFIDAGRDYLRRRYPAGAPQPAEAVSFWARITGYTDAGQHEWERVAFDDSVAPQPVTDMAGDFAWEVNGRINVAIGSIVWLTRYDAATPGSGEGKAAWLFDLGELPTRYEGDVDIYVAKPYELQHTAGNYSGITSLTTIDTQTVEMSDGAETAEFAVTPPYKVGAYISVDHVNWTGITVSGQPLLMEDRNVAGRAWATETPETT